MASSVAMFLCQRVLDSIHSNQVLESRFAVKKILKLLKVNIFTKIHKNIFTFNESLSNDCVIKGAAGVLFHWDCPIDCGC